ncbi:hypothetical protein Tco_0579397 [Tanacetum coccineum]
MLIISIAKCTVENLVELGIIAAKCWRKFSDCTKSVVERIRDLASVDSLFQIGKAMGSKRIEKSPTIPVAVLGLCNTLTWVEIEKKLRKKPPMKH